MTTPAHAPRARPAAVTVAGCVSLAVTALGVLVLLDAVLPETGDHRSQLRRLTAALDGLTASGATTAVGAGAVVLGLALVAAALRPARRTHLRARCAADVWLTPRAVSRLVIEAAERRPGVLEARAEHVRRRRVNLAVTPRRPGEGAAVAAAVQEALHDDLDRVEGTILVVRAREDA